MRENLFAAVQTTRYLERSPISTEIFNVTIPPLDFALYHATSATFQLESVDPVSTRMVRYFDINGTTGLITLSNNLDYELIESYILTVAIIGSMADGSSNTSRVAVVVSLHCLAHSGLLLRLADKLTITPRAMI